MSVTLDDIRAAAVTFAGQILLTPTIAAPRLSERLGTNLRLKLENLQYTGSFKDRGALNKLKNLTPDQARVGVIAMSAGNHAQGVACHSGRLGIPATIVMPVHTPFNKVERTESFGARVLLHGETLSESEAAARELVERDGLTLIHPYDDPLIIAGQGTVALEMLEAAPDLDLLVIPIGGGGLIAGIATAAKALKPDIEVIGVQATSYPSMKQYLAGEPVTCSGPTIAEGIAVKAPGKLTSAIIRDLVSDIVLVTEDHVERAVDALLTIQKISAEGAGAAGVAALLADPERFAGRQIGVVICGGNIDARMLASILMRGLVRNRRLVRLRIAITDAPGALARVTRLIGEAGADIVEVFHHRLFYDLPVKMADIDVILETRNPAHVDQIIASLGEGGFPAELMEDVD
jgi:threonine dehydratase